MKVIDHVVFVEEVGEVAEYRRAPARVVGAVSKTAVA
jgi:hypothetical protein